MGVRPRLLLAALTVIVLAAPALDSCTYDNPPVLELDNRTRRLKATPPAASASSSRRTHTRISSSPTVTCPAGL